MCVCVCVRVRVCVCTCVITCIHHIVFISLHLHPISDHIYNCLVVYCYRSSWQCLRTAVSSYQVAIHSLSTCTVHVHCVHSLSTCTVHVHCVHLYNTVLYMYIVFTCTTLYCTCTLCSSVQHCTVHVHCVNLYNTVLYVQMYYSCTKGEK